MGKWILFSVSAFAEALALLAAAMQMQFLPPLGLVVIAFVSAVIGTSTARAMQWLVAVGAAFIMLWVTFEVLLLLALRDLSQLF